MDKPVILLALALAAGILLGQAFLYFPCSTFMLVALAGVIGIIAFRQRHSARRFAVMGPAILIGAVLLVWSATSLPSDHYSTRSTGKSNVSTIREGYPLLWTGTREGPPSRWLLIISTMRPRPVRSG